MSSSKPPHTEEFRRQMVDLVRAGRLPRNSRRNTARRGGRSVTGCGKPPARTTPERTRSTPPSATASRATYGAPRVHADQAAAGVQVSRKRVARLMKQAGLYGVHRHRRVSLTRRDRAAHLPPDLVNRDFSAPPRTRSGPPTSPTSRPARAGSTSPSSSTCTPGASSAGPCPPTRKPPPKR
ncbi:hypothetical protein FAGKG844_590028 [Frankia sp. AgKG'84/4]